MIMGILTRYLEKENMIYKDADGFYRSGFTIKKRLNTILEGLEELHNSPESSELAALKKDIREKCKLLIREGETEPFELIWYGKKYTRAKD